jgi:dolichol-phosphate mannosyltransferase
MPDAPEVTIVIPFYNEEENVVPVLEEVLRCQPGAEVIAVDDGSRDRTWDGIRSVPGVTGLRLTQNRGQSGAVYAGLRAARGRLVATMDGDGQNDPADFERMLAVLREGSADLVCGLRAKRKDTWSRRAASKAANWIRRRFLEDGVRDTGCGLKAFRREHVELLVPFNGLHRYVPAIFKAAGLRLAEVPVNHRPRTRGASKYTNWERALRGIYDLIGVSWLLKRKVVYPAIERSEPAIKS